MAYKEDIKEVANLNLPWDKLSGCNILITGATGLVGSCLVDVLMTHPNKDYQVFATGRNEKRARDRFYDFFYDPAFHFFKFFVIETLNANSTIKCKITKCFCKSTPLVLRHSISFLVSHYFLP